MEELDVIDKIFLEIFNTPITYKASKKNPKKAGKNTSAVNPKRTTKKVVKKSRASIQTPKPETIVRTVPKTPAEAILAKAEENLNKGSVDKTKGILGNIGKKKIAGAAALAIGAGVGTHYIRKKLKARKERKAAEAEEIE